MSKLTLFIDADSLPVKIRQIVLRRIFSDGLCAIFCADRLLKDVDSAIQSDTAHLRALAKERGVTDKRELKKIKSAVRMVVVPPADGAADDYLVEHLSLPGLGITHDIPLAKRMVSFGVEVLDDRGNRYDSGNIDKRLSERNVNTIFRSWGVQSEKTERMDERTIREFAASFDTVLTELERSLRREGHEECSDGGVLSR